MLGPNDGDVKLFAPDGFTTQRRSTRRASAAPGMFMSVAGVPIDEFKGEGAGVRRRRSQADARRQGDRPVRDLRRTGGAGRCSTRSRRRTASRARRDREAVRDEGHGRLPRLVRDQRERRSGGAEGAVVGFTIYKATDKLDDRRRSSRRSRRPSTRRAASRRRSTRERGGRALALPPTFACRVPPPPMAEPPTSIDYRRASAAPSVVDLHRPRRSSRCVVVWLVVNFVKEPAEFINIALIGLTNGAIYGARRARLHARLRHPAADQLRARRRLRARRASSRAPSSSACSASTTDSSGARRSSAASLVTLVVIMVGVRAASTPSIERVAYRPLRSAPRLAPLITAVGMSFIVQNIGLAFYGVDYQTVPNFIPRTDVVRDRRRHATRGTSSSSLADHDPAARRSSPGSSRSTKQGKAMRAVAQDTEASAMMGINVNRTISVTFAARRRARRRRRASSTCSSSTCATTPASSSG